MMSALPTVTLAIPCFNAEQHIRGALESILRQSIAVEEIVVVDDGSTDRTRDAVSLLPGVRLISHGENRGIAASRNSAWQAARGEVVVYMDADCIAEPGFLASLLQGYEDDTVAGVGGCGIEAIDNTMYDRWRREVLFQHWGAEPRETVPFLFGLCSSYRRSVLQQLGGFDTLFRTSGEDMDMGFRMNRAGYRLLYTPDGVVNHQRADDRATIRKMVYRHCFWGFFAQRKNSTCENKVPVVQSAGILLRHIFIDGLLRGSWSYTAHSLRMHADIARAWFDARAGFAEFEKNGIPPVARSWEGHSHSDG